MPASVEMAGRALFTGSQATYERSQQLLLNSQWPLAQHEWAYSLTPVALIILLAGTILLLREHRKIALPTGVPAWWCLLILTIILITPIAINTYTPGWNEVLKSLPFIGSSSSLFRWYIIYVAVIPVACAIVLAHASILTNYRTQFAIGITVATIALTAFEDRTYYFEEDARYPVEPITQAWHALKTATQAPRILGVEQVVGLAGESGQLVRNNLIIKEFPQPLCYNPVFGYRLESLPLNGITTGSPYQLTDGTFNFKNPACYVYPEANDCEPGDHFKAADRTKLDALLNFQPWEFETSKTQKIANAVTQFSLVLCLLLMLAMLGTNLRTCLASLKNEIH